MKIEPGQQYEVKFPFVVSTYTVWDEDGEHEEPTWKPGCREEFYSPEDTEFVADAEGEMILTVVDVHKPGHYPERVFYTRKWRDPEGNVFGATKLHITTTSTFKRRARGYYYPYRVL